VQQIIDAKIPFDRLCFKDASGTSTPTTVRETMKAARKVLEKAFPGKHVHIQFHSHETAGNGIACYLAALEGGADGLDLSMTPMSGGTCQPDIITMWHALDGDDRFELEGIDIEKVRKAEAVFKEQMKDYFLPPEAMSVSPSIVWSPMPGGALTAITQMLRDFGMMDKYDAMIAEMYDCVRLGGFGTSVTPVSQFYGQQALNNAMFGKWKKIAPGYGKMVLGYFGKTPVEPDPQVVKWAQDQLQLEPTTKSVVEINDANPKLGVKYNTELLQQNNLPVTEENIFIAAACGDKGIAFLKGDKPMGIRYAADAAPKAKNDVPAAYTVTVEGKTFNVQVKEGGVITADLAGQVTEGGAAKKAAAPSAGSGNTVDINSPFPGTVTKILVSEGDEYEAGDVIAVVEAMKMENEIKPDKAGVIREICVDVKAVVTSGQALFKFEEK
jgi:pyruvate carboxylase subunit B